MSKQNKRVYNSEGRKAQAAKTRRRILSSAKELFRQQGFEAVTINTIAEAAEVSAPSVYAIFKSKKGVLRGLIEDAMAPDQFLTLVQQAREFKKAEEPLRIGARIARQLYDAEREVMDLFQGATLIAPDLKEIEREREEGRYERQREVVELMYQRKVLKKELSVSQARDILWALTGRDLYRLLVVDRGWTPDFFEQWLGDHLEASLLD